MASHDPLDRIHHALLAHDIPATRDANEVRLDRHDLCFRTAIFDRDQRDGGHRLVLEIYVFSPLLGARLIAEAFVGWGETRDEALALAFEKFQRGVFHVLIEGLADHVCDSMQAEVEHWSRGDTAWKAFSGLVIPQAVDEATLPNAYPKFYAELADLFTATASPGPHFLRIFLGSLGGKIASGEVLLDNETWPEGEALLFGQDWECGEEYQSVRQVILALPWTGSVG